MRQPWIAIAAVVSLVAASAHAQEDAGVGGEESAVTEPADAGVAAPTEEPSLAAPVADGPHKPDPEQYPPRQRWADRAKQRQIQALGAAMYVEGLEYSWEKNTGYVVMITGGALLEAGGAVSLVYSFLFAIIAASGGGSWVYDGCDDSLDEECAERDKRQEKQARTNAWILLPVGVVAIVAGLPLIIKGARGHKRQKLLRRKEEILGTAHLNGIWLAASPAGEGAAGGLMLSGSF